MSADTRSPETLAERFWSLARGMDTDSPEPAAVVAHVLAVLDALDSGRIGHDLTANTLNFLALLRQYEVKGDLLYASPEQARGEQMDERSLVFSIGVLLFEKVTGRHPFGAEGNPQRLARIRRGEMASGVNYFPKVPGELRVVLVKAMGPFPEERYRSLSDLRLDLEMFLDRTRHPEDYSAPRSARPLPALPDDEPTRIRRVPGPAVDLARMATVSARHSAARFETQPAAPELSYASLDPPRSRTWAVLAVSAALGALAASGAFWLLWPARPVSPAAPAAPPSAAPEPAPNPAPPQISGSGSESESGSSSRSDAATQSDPGSRASAEAAFDIELGGRNALAAARGCIPAERRVQFGASLLYEASTGRSRKVYFAAASQLAPAERQCANRSLIGLTAGAPPARATVVTYSFLLAPGREDVKSRLASSE